MIKIEYNSNNTILKWDENGSVLPGEGNHKISIFGIPIYNRMWDNKYEDLTKNDIKKVTGFK